MPFASPHAGAWIETIWSAQLFWIEPTCRPHAGAWIETKKLSLAGKASMSPPRGGRGLKLGGRSSIGCGSPTTRGRGLKRWRQNYYHSVTSRRPHAGAWIEKRNLSPCVSFLKCRPHAGAWIETFCYNKFWFSFIGRPHAGAWIETTHLSFCSVGGASPPRGGVD